MTIDTYELARSLDWLDPTELRAMSVGELDEAAHNLRDLAATAEAYSALFDRLASTISAARGLDSSEATVAEALDSIPAGMREGMLLMFEDEGQAAGVSTCDLLGLDPANLSEDTNQLLALMLDGVDPEG